MIASTEFHADGNTVKDHQSLSLGIPPGKTKAESLKTIAVLSEQCVKLAERVLDERQLDRIADVAEWLVELSISVSGDSIQLDEFNGRMKSLFREAVRTALWERHPYCYLCNGKIVSVKKATIDHVHPVSGGGSDNVSNLDLCCAFCNHFKNKMPLHEFHRKLSTMAENVRYRIEAEGGAV